MTSGGRRLNSGMSGSDTQLGICKTSRFEQLLTTYVEWTPISCISRRVVLNSNIHNLRAPKFDTPKLIGPQPNDEDEQDRMDLIHHICRLVLGGRLYLAPIDEKVQRILDLGTGTGIWAIDIAEYDFTSRTEPLKKHLL